MLFINFTKLSKLSKIFTINKLQSLYQYLTLTMTCSIIFSIQPFNAQAAPVNTSPEFIIEDNDFSGPGQSDIQSTIPLLTNPRVHVLGFTVAVGDDWENAESAHLRRFLEIAHHANIPVANGAVLPLKNRVHRMREWEQLYGTIPWKGAWGGDGSIQGIPETQPHLSPLPEGNPHTPAIPESAVDFLIHQVHAHPGQVTIVENGPMTNLALAIQKDPNFAATAKQLIFMGGLLDRNMMAVTGNADYASDFNFIFDPEAAHITLHAPWRKITSLGNVADSIMFDQTLANHVNTTHTPVTEYLRKYFAPLPMWDEMSSAVAADPSLIQHSVTALMDVDTCWGMDYGRAHVWNDSLAPKHQGLQHVILVQSIDIPRFTQQFIAAAQHLH